MGRRAYRPSSAAATTSSYHLYQPIGKPTCSALGDEGIRHDWTAFRRTPLPPPAKRSRSCWHDDSDLPQPSEDEKPIGEEVFEIGSVVLVKHTTALPLLAVITQLWSDEDEEHDDSDGGSEAGDEEDYVPLSMGLRFFTWSEDLTAGSRERLKAILGKNEVFYQDQSVSLPSSRTSKRSQAAVQLAIKDDFAAGPSLTKHSGWSVARILGSASVYPTLEEAEEAAKADKRPSQLHHKGRAIPRHLFCRKAAHPRKELFWHIHYPDLVAQGRSGGGWDIKVHEGDARGRGPVEWAEEEKRKAKASGKPLPSETADESRAKQKGQKAARPAKASPTKRRKLDKSTPSGRPQHHSESESDDEDSDTSDEGEESDAGSEYSLTKERQRWKSGKKSGKADESDEDSTEATSDEEEDEEEETFDDDEWDDDEDVGSKRKRRQAGPSTPRKPRATAIGKPTPRSKRIIDLQRDTRQRLFDRSQGASSGAFLPDPSSSLPSQFESQSDLDAMTAHERAKRLLHVSTTPSRLPCRTTQAENLLCLLEDSLDTGIGSCIYISGVPGTGKTATVRGVISLLQQRSERGQVNPFDFLEINGMKVADAGEAYSMLWSVVGDRGISAGSGRARRSPKAALNLLSRHYADNGRGPADDMGQGSGRATTIVLMDELDQLLTSRQDVMYNLFNWPSARNSRLIVVAVANTMDLPERTMSAKVASRLGMTRITFMPYADKELGEIVRSRLGIDASGKSIAGSASLTPIDEAGEMAEEDMDESLLFDDDAQRLLSKEERQRKEALYSSAVRGCDAIFVNDAITYAAKRISNVSGDARRMLDVCRRAVELVEAKHRSKSLPPSGTESATATAGASAGDVPRITIGDIKSVLDGMVKSSKPSHIARSLSLHTKVLLVSLVNLTRKTGLAEVTLADLAAHYRALCRLHSINNQKGADAGIENQEHALAHLLAPLNALVGLGFVIAVGAGHGPGKAAGFARVMLVLREDEVRLALEADGDERVRGML